MRRRTPTLFISTLAILVAIVSAAAAQGITTPKQQFGFDIGDDYQLATYDQFVEYWHKLDKESDRMKVVEIGKTAEGRPQLMAIITAPDNFKKIDRYKEISRRLATVDGLTDEQAHALAKEGKAVVWFDGGLHATEVLGAHQLIETVYQLVSRNDPETLRFLNDLVILAVHANPDGMQLVSSWYMREKDPPRRSMTALPRLYEKYAGHDNNRDFYMSNLPESINMNKVLYSEWFPQIMYNHHQTGPAGAVMFAPPFRDPFNFNFDPLVPIGIDIVGAAMANRMAAEGKPGLTSRKGSSYSTWWNGGLRTTVYFHNMIGLLTETIGSPTPISIPFVPSKQLPDSNLYYPIEPQQTWHFRQSIDYSVTANYAVFDVASRNKDTFLYNIYLMGKNSIERGSRDSWTTSPRRIAAAEASLTAPNGGRGGQGAEAATDEASAPAGAGGRGGRAATVSQFKTLLRDPSLRDPRGFILPSDQPDFPTATQFINALIRTGIVVHRATAQFTIGAKTYPAGSFVVKAAQPFRPHVLDMFEPQDHPDDIPYPGGPPTRPYDNAGWTLAYQMGVKFDRILEAFDGPFERINGLQKPLPGKAAPSATVLLAHSSNNAFIAVNRLLAAGRDVRWTQAPGNPFYIAGASVAELQKLATDLGINFEPAGQATSLVGAVKLRRPRIGLADVYGGSIPSGWTRFVLEQFEFPFDVVYPKAIDAGNLSSRFDVLIFPSDVGPAPTGGRGGGGRGGAAGDGAATIPSEYQPMLGSYSAEQSGAALKKFLDDGGTILGVGRSSMNLARVLGLPVENHLTERSADGSVRPIPVEKYYVPGSILRLTVDNSAAIANGVDDHVDVFFDNSPVFSLGPEAVKKGVRPVAWFDTPAPLRSGWAFGQGYLNGGIEILQATVGRGNLILFAPEITFRAQPHGTFKFLFNGLLLGSASAGAAPTGADGSH
jgi:zinc carboxypeptidase